MEPRSADDSRQLIKLQRGILTAVVAMQDQILALHNKKVEEAAEELEREKQRLHDEIAAPVQLKVRQREAPLLPPHMLEQNVCSLTIVLP